ncbi:MAG: hypothetical protein U9R66_03425 [Thermodesulfobacteriota bacterium]|nr:hypothetical protein [Thermodesulfobacteriota bacterium]
MNTAQILQKLHKNFRFSQDRLIDFFNTPDLDIHGFKINEFVVFSSFLVTFAYLRQNKSEKIGEILENFHKSIIISIVDRIVEEAGDTLDQNRIDELTETIKKVLMERYKEYFREIAAGSENHATIKSLPLLVDSFLGHGLAQPVDEPVLVRANLTACIEEIITKFG